MKMSIGSLIIKKKKKRNSIKKGITESFSQKNIQYVVCCCCCRCSALSYADRRGEISLIFQGRSSVNRGGVINNCQDANAWHLALQ